jgi:hypothetical protein
LINLKGIGVDDFAIQGLWPKQIANSLLPLPVAPVKTRII